MTQSNMPSVGQNREKNLLADKDSQKPVRRCDLIELVLGPLSDQIDRMRLEILETIREGNESTEIMARQARRQMDE